MANCLECGKSFDPPFKTDFCKLECQIRWTIKDELKKQNIGVVN